MASNKVNITIPSLSSLKFQVKLEGNWVGLDKISASLQEAVDRGYQQGIDQVGRKLLKLVRTCILTGTPPPGTYWPPHAPSTTKRYGGHPIYNLTGTYARSISVVKYKSRTLVGIPLRKGLASQKGITLNQLAILLEHGSKGFGEDGNIPPRPVWGPSLKAVGGRRYIKATILTSIRKSLYQHGIKANQVK